MKMDQEQNRLDKVVSRLKQTGHRITPQRLAILEALVNGSGHPTAEEVHRKIQARFPTTSLATVYKTINLLKIEGEILELEFGDLGNRFDGHKPYPHPHMICTQCGRIVDSDLDELESLVQTLAEQSGYQVQAHRFDVFGLCPDCQKTK